MHAVRVLALGCLLSGMLALTACGGAVDTSAGNAPMPVVERDRAPPSVDDYIHSVYGPPRPTALQQIDMLDADEGTKEMLRLRWHLNHLEARLSRIKSVRADSNPAGAPWYLQALANEEAQTRQDLDRIRERLRAIE